jgi:hypothetical protein
VLKFSDEELLAGVWMVLIGFGPMGASAVSAQLPRFRAVLTLRSSLLIRKPAGAFSILSSAQLHGAMRALP